MLGLAAAAFDSHVLSLPLALVLFCVPSIALCPLLEAELARATLLLSDAERARASLLSVNISEPGAEGLRTKYALTTAAPSLLLFRRGRPELYEGSRKAEAVAEFLRGVVAGREGSPRANAPPPPVRGGGHAGAGAWSSAGGGAASAVLALTAENFEAVRAEHPLLLVLFYSPDELEAGGYLLGNFSAAASELREQGVAAQLGWLQVPWEDEARVKVARSCRVSELPDLKILHHGVVADYRAGAEMFDLVDIARWNAGLLQVQRAAATSHVRELSGWTAVTSALAEHEVTLLAFSTRWCTRCLRLARELDAASALLAAAAPPVGIVIVNVDDPHNQPLVERFKVFSFPVGKVFHRGRFALDYGGGSQDFEIVEWMLAMRDELQRGAAATRRAGKEEL